MGGDARPPQSVPWRTKVEPELLAGYGVSELHNVFFEPLDGQPGPANVVSVGIPELEAQSCSSVLCIGTIL